MASKRLWTSCLHSFLLSPQIPWGWCWAVQRQTIYSVRLITVEVPIFYNGLRAKSPNIWPGNRHYFYFIGQQQNCFWIQKHYLYLPRWFTTQISLKGFSAEKSVSVFSHRNEEVQETHKELSPRYYLQYIERAYDFDVQFCQLGEPPISLSILF